MQDFRNLKVWQKSHGLTLAVYRCSAEFPRAEMFGLTSQIRRSSSSVPTNIAEGCGRGSDSDFRRFLQIAMGSACELDYQLLLARDLTYLPESDYLALSQDLVEIKRMLTSLLQKLRPEG
jgi:four helix bundle protein